MTARESDQGITAVFRRPEDRVVAALEGMLRVAEVLRRKRGDVAADEDCALDTGERRLECAPHARAQIAFSLRMKADSEPAPAFSEKRGARVRRAPQLDGAEPRILCRPQAVHREPAMQARPHPPGRARESAGSWPRPAGARGQIR